MNLSAYIEDTLVQHTTVKYMKEELGWEPVYFYK